MTETKQRFYNSIGQDVTELKYYETKIDGLREEFPFMKRLENYISKKYKEAEESDSKSHSKKAEDLGWCAYNLLTNFKDLMTKTAISDRYTWYGGHLSLGLDENDPLEIKLQDLGELFTKRFDILMNKGPYLFEDENLSEEDQKQKELIVRYIRENRISYGRDKLFEDESFLYKSYLNTLINARVWGGHPEEIKRICDKEKEEIIKLPPHKEYSRDYFTFLTILDNLKNGIKNKVTRRELTEKEYKHIVNTPTEKFFYELTEEHNLILK